jgi:hypothetical protein
VLTWSTAIAPVPTGAPDRMSQRNAVLPSEAAMHSAPLSVPLPNTVTV